MPRKDLRLVGPQETKDVAKGIEQRTKKWVSDAEKRLRDANDRVVRRFKLK